MLGFARKLVKQAEGIIAPDSDAAGPSYGFRVLAVEPDSEAFHHGLEPLFDFVIAANGERFDRQVGNYTNGPVSIEAEQSPAAELEQVVRATDGRLVLEVWSAKGRGVRVVALPNPARGLGLSLQWTPLSAAESVWHILDVCAGSAADQAGLISDSDYIVGAEKGLLDEGGEGLLGRVASRADPHQGVLFYVYNRDYDVVRPVRVVPARDGKLGCSVGYGLLHFLPSVARQTRVPPGHTLFDDDALHTAAPTTTTQTTTATQTTPAAMDMPLPVARTRHTHHHEPADPAGLDSYFDEQSKISHEIDGSSAAQPKAAVPPPPKAH